MNAQQTPNREAELRRRHVAMLIDMRDVAWLRVVNPQGDSTTFRLQQHEALDAAVKALEAQAGGLS